MKLATGTRLGPYEILEPIGVGVGERYKATDTRANRVVALTILPPGFIARADMRARLERDARALAALRDAPLSGALEIGHAEPATDFVVSDLVAGETLAARLARGRPELAEALAMALGIAEALDQAHRGGVVHGALTPANVLLTEHGPRLVDFGLAPVLEAVSAASLPAAAATSHSAPGVTQHRHAPSAANAPANAAYQAPERLAGAAADARADLFSCGAVIYELVTGRPAFAEKTAALLIAAVQTVDPDPPSQLQPLAPPALDHVVARCLAKDPAERLQTARDLVHQLRWVLEGGSQLGIPAPLAARRRTRERLTWAAAAAGLLLAIGLAPAAYRQLTPKPGPPVVRFTLSGLPTQATTPLGVSPDGRWVVSVPTVAQGNGMIGLPLDAVTPEWLNTENTLYHSFWSPDSRSLGFWEGGFVKAVDLAGGAARTLAPAPGLFGGGTWGRDGVIVFSSGGLLWRVSDKGGEPTPVTALDESLGETEHLEPFFLPDGRHFLYVAISAESAIYLAALDSPERTRLFAAESAPVYAAPGYILFNRGNALFAQPFHAEERILTGDPIRVADGLLMMGTAPGLSPNLARSAVFAASQTGVLVFRSAGGTAGATGAAAPRLLEWKDRSGRTTPVGPEAAYVGIDLAPNGMAAAVHVHSSDGGDIFTLGFAQGRLQRLTLDATQHNSSPIWAPDGRRIAFASRRGGLWGLYVKRADGAGAEELIYESSAEKMPASWSPDGNLLVYTESGDIWAVSTTGDAQPRPIVRSPAFDGFPTVSPAGGWIAYASADTGRPEIYVQQFPEGPTRRQVSIDSGLGPRWRDDGRELYFTVQGTLTVLASTIDIDGESVQPGVPREVFTLGGSPNVGVDHPPFHRYAVSGDGERLLVSRPTTGGSAGGLDTQIAALADAGITQSGPGSRANVVILNWPRMIEAR